MQVGFPARPAVRVLGHFLSGPRSVQKLKTERVVAVVVALVAATQIENWLKAAS